MQKNIIKMEAETIDLTDPLEELLRRTGWTPEYLQERLEKLTEENANKDNTNRTDIEDMTLSDLLGDFKCSTIENDKNIEITETIELSDDEINDVTNKEENEVQEVTEVRVIEIDDDDNENDYNGEYSEDDDDEFLEESTFDMLQSNIKTDHENSIEFEKCIDDNLIINKNRNSNLLPTDYSNNRESEKSDKMDDLLEKNKKEIHIDISRVAKTPPPLMNSENDETSTPDEFPTVNRKLLADKDQIVINKNENQKLDDCNDSSKSILLDDTQLEKNFDSTQAICENYIKRVNTFLCCDSNPVESNTSNISKDVGTFGSNLRFLGSEVQGSLKECSAKVTLSDTEITDAICKDDKVKIVDNNLQELKSNTKKGNVIDVSITNNLNSDGITEKLVVQKEIADVVGLNTTGTLTKLSNLTNPDLPSVIVNPETENVRDIMDTVITTEKILDKQEVAFAVTSNISDESIKESNLVICDLPLNESSCDMSAVKSIEDFPSMRKSVDDIIEQLDMACQEGNSPNKDSNIIEINIADNTKDVIAGTGKLNNLPLMKENESEKFSNQNTNLGSFSQKVVSEICREALRIDSPTSILLKSLDEAIETCDQNIALSLKDCVKDNVEHCIQKTGNISDNMLNVKNAMCESKMELSEMQNDNLNKNASNEVFSTTTVSVSCEDIQDPKLNKESLLTIRSDSVNEENHECSTKINSSNQSNINYDTYEEYGSNNEVRATIDEAAEPSTETSCDIFNPVINNSINSSKHVLQNVNPASADEINPINTEASNISHIAREEAVEKSSVNFKIPEFKLKTDFNLQIKGSTDSKIRKFGKKSQHIGDTERQVTRKETQNVNDSNKNIEATHINNLSLTQITTNNSSSNIDIIDNADMLNIVDVSPNLDKNMTSIQEIPLGDTGIPSNENALSINNETQKICTDRIIDKSANSIQNISLVGSSKNEQKSDNELDLKSNIFSTNDNFTETFGSDKELKHHSKNNTDENNIVEEKREENFEEIRKNLKLQLTSLRNKKRRDILQDVKTKVDNIEFSKNLSDDISKDSDSLLSFKTLHKINSSESKEKSNENLQPIKKDSVLVFDPSLTPHQETTTEKKEDVNEDIRIVETTIEKHEDEDVPNVFNEIRKIIRKQRSSSKITISKSVDNLESSALKCVGDESQKDEKMECRIDQDINKTISEDITTENNEDIGILMSNDLEDKNVPPGNVINSPFVSNSLDEFLTDAKLNVSYTIPKSGAEEGLRLNYSDEPIMPPIVGEIKEEDSGKSTQEIKYKPKTLAEKRRLLEKSILKEKKRLAKLKKLEDAKNRSYILFKNKKIFLNTKSKGKCIASIESSTPIPMNEINDQATPRKPSLLTELYKKSITPVKYKPGPLCKKHLLQTDYSNWNTELQTLPKVILKIMPELGKPIHPNLLHILPQWDGEVTDDQIEFALSALVTKGDHKIDKIFQFNVPYGKQQTQILTRKRIVDKSIIQLESMATKERHSSTSEEGVVEVIEKLLNYVEIKEIEPTLVKYDEDITMSDEDPVKIEVPPIDNHVCVKRKSRITKTDRELMRLNCKVVSVEVEENEPERKCSKPYCRLGCICKSLQCERIIGLHCQKLKCIFGCTCPKEKDKIISIAEPRIKLPIGTDLLSMDTVTRIEGEAKRNLARVEKEFTQTVIHTNDKTIVVGFGNKPRRATKTPKKYTDFFEDEIAKDESKEPKKEKIVLIRQCSVNLLKWDFSDLSPYCLIHHLYNCHCQGLSVFSLNISCDSLKTEEKPERIKREEYSFSAKNHANVLISTDNSKKRYPKKTVEESFKAIIRKSATLEKNNVPDFEETLYSVTGRPLRKKKKIYEADFVFDVDSVAPSCKKSETERESFNNTEVPHISEPINCSRTCEISQKYQRKIRSFTNVELDSDFANNITDADLLRAHEQINNNDISDSDYLKKTIIEERKKLLEETEIEIHKKKRKQKIQVRKDEDITIKATKKIVQIPKAERKGKVKSVFKGEIIVNDSEWLKKLGQNAKQPLEGYARILPWNALLYGFLSKTINIYCISDMPLRLLLNVGSKLTGGRIMDVETFGQKILATPLRAKASWLLSQSENVREIIKWLLSGTLPSKYKSNCLSFLLVETLPDQFEVRGLCTQGTNKEDTNPTEKNSPEEGEISDQITEVKHKNVNNEIESLFITKGKFRLRELVEDGFDDDLTDNLYMWVGLPEVYKVGKWRVVFLNNDFSFLYFKNINYSIKYTDLVKLTEMAKEEAITLILRNIHIRRSYEHAMFGLYVSHNYQDRIFIGPYFVDYDDDDIDTLRYINQSLVSSESFNKMTGNPNYKCGHWMYERIYYHTPTVYMKDTIDLTNDDSPPKYIKSILQDNHQGSSNTNMSVDLSSSSISSVNNPQSLIKSTIDEHVIYHNGMPIHIKNSKPRTPSEFNRFIITNIPHFGYLGAYQPDNSPALEVSWPFEKKVLQFENADNARDFLQERFNQLLQPVPDTFQIQVIVLIQLDLKEHQPINSDFLSGHCICGYFGTYNFRELSDEFCKEELKISKEEITKLFANRAHACIGKKIEELAETVGIMQNDSASFNVPTILVRATEEIKSLENIRRQQVSDIQTLESQVVVKLKKLYGLVNSLPVKHRNIESKIINEILQIRPKRLSANEVVEIKDDDEDEDDDSGRTTPTIQSDLIVYSVEESDDTNLPEQPLIKPSLKRKRTYVKKARNPKVIYNVEESDDTNLPEQPLIKPSLKRKRTYEKKARNPKVAKIAPFTSTSYKEPSASASVLKSRPNNKPEAATSNKNISTKSKHKILIVRPQRNIDEPTGTVSDDMETATANEDPEIVTINEDIETITINDDIETVTINDDIDTEMITEEPDYRSENFIDEDGVSHFIIEYADSDQINDSNVTEILVSEPDTAENIDLSMATIIASVPPASITDDINPITIQPSGQSEPITSSIKTYSTTTEHVTIKPIPAETHVTDLDIDQEQYATFLRSKELTNKIKIAKITKVRRKRDFSR